MKNANNTTKHYTQDAGLLRERLARDLARWIRCGGVTAQESFRWHRLARHLAYLTKAKVHQIETQLRADAEQILANEPNDA